MILDFEPSNGNYILRAPYAMADELKNQYGLDIWPHVLPHYVPPVIVDSYTDELTVQGALIDALRQSVL